MIPFHERAKEAPPLLKAFGRSRWAIKKAPQTGRCCSVELAEEEGFEPPDLLQSTVFKTAAIDHSAILPRQKYVTSLLCKGCLFWEFFS